ncbi:MAG: S9 family peptidase [Ardenticatenaceae bacterium]|nr:S9 family peptidase [Ardenticatenaceae bacterium]
MKPQPPVAVKRPSTFTLHNHTWTDDYFWLRERENPEVIAYLEAENEYLKAMMAHTEDLQEQLYQEMRGRIKETDLTVPYPKGDYLYYDRTEEGKQYPIYCRQRQAEGAEEEVLLDQNALAEGLDFCRMGVFRVSPNHELLAYSLDTNGSEQYTLYVKNLQTGEQLPEAIPNTSYSAEWANDNETLFYTALDEARRPFQLHRHSLGTDHTQDVLLHQESDDHYYVTLRRTRSGAYLVLHISSNITTEEHYVAADEPQAAWQVLAPRQQGVEYDLTHHGDTFYIRTNEGAENFKLMVAPVAQPEKANWQVMLPYRQEVTITAVHAFQNHLVIETREDGLEQLIVHNLADGSAHHIEFPEPTYAVWLGNNEEFATKQLRFVYNSLITPESVFDYDMDERSRVLRKQQEVIGYDASLYESARVWATAVDGTKIPLGLAYRKGTELNGQNPLYMTGYGSYGANYPDSFSGIRFSLIDRGFVFAIAHIRGGGEMGEGWRNDGKLLKKKNTFTDFIACADHLVEAGYTNSHKLAVMGGSAGGLLMGAITNLRPELFKVVIAHVPFVDVINTMLDASIPLTVIEYDEWGNPNEPEFFAYMQSYSPYDQVEAKDYPHLLVTAGLNDPRVQYWEPAKWVAKLRAVKTDENWLVLKTNMGAGHAGASGRFDRLKEHALEYAFILDRLK